MIICTLMKLYFKVIYFFMKFKKTENKICFFTRQSNTLPLDFKLLIDEIHKRDSSIEIVTICQRATINFKEIVAMYKTTIKQMNLLATSKAVVIDGYCLPVSILKHKKDLYVLQIWHSIGKIKKSSYQTYKYQPLWQRAIGKLMNLHKGYDNVVASGTKFNKYYAECFRIDPKIILNYGLPRIDYLIKEEPNIRKKIYKQYKEFKNKKVVLYAPTFRKYNVDQYKDLLKTYNKDDFILIVKNHPSQKLDLPSDIYTCNEFSATELITVSDYVITDYSSISVEAAVLNKKTMYYLYDYSIYNELNGLNVDPSKVMKHNCYFNSKALINAIITDSYDLEEFNKYRKNYLPKELGTSTVKIVDKILKEIAK